jgi:Ca-activated chloride channel family protein
MRRLVIGPLLILAIVLSACGGVGGLGGGDTVEVSVVYGSEKRAWLEAMIEEFNAQGVETPEGTRIEVTATPMGSNDSLNQILAGTIQPTVWSPASGILLPVANERWAAANGGTLVDEAPPLVLSPVVIAIWEPMARALGYPDKQLGWADIAELAASGQTWADYGFPEWGAFQFGHTHPEYSNSGITSILATAYAATGKTRDLSLADVQAQSTSDFIRDVESGVIHYGESTGFFAEQMFTRGPAYLSAAVLYENLVVESYNRERYPNLATPVVAIYPREGTFWSDHPYAVLNAPWVSDEQRAGAIAFRDFLLSRPQQERALEFGFRPADPNVPVGEPITASNGVDPAQPQTLLEVPSVPVIEAVQAAWVSNKKRVDVLAVLDVSGSMGDEGRLEQAKLALRDFIGSLEDDDGFGLITFGNEATVLTELGPIGPKRQELLDRISGLFPRGNTRLVDTLSEAYATLSAEPPGRRIRAIVLLSDGADNRSEAGSVEQLLATLQGEEEGTSIKVFTIAYGTGTDVNAELLEQIAQASGAKTYEAAPDRIQQVYRDIATFF